MSSKKKVMFDGLAFLVAGRMWIRPAARAACSSASNPRPPQHLPRTNRHTLVRDAGEARCAGSAAR